MGRGGVGDCAGMWMVTFLVRDVMDCCLVVVVSVMFTGVTVVGVTPWVCLEETFVVWVVIVKFWSAGCTCLYEDCT